MEATKTYFTATGRRKESVARVRLRVGTGKIKANKREFEDYFPRETLRILVGQPFQVTGTTGKYDVFATLDGGGVSGQAGALRHGISRALLKVDEKTGKQNISSYLMLSVSASISLVISIIVFIFVPQQQTYINKTTENTKDVYSYGEARDFPNEDIVKSYYN